MIANGNITTRGDNAAGHRRVGLHRHRRGFDRQHPHLRRQRARHHGHIGAGDVAVISSGNITTTGDTSDGINVVSTNGMAAVVNSGDISATGSGSAGIYAAGYAGTSVINFGTIIGCPCGAGVILRALDRRQQPHELRLDHRRA